MKIIDVLEKNTSEYPTRWNLKRFLTSKKKSNSCKKFIEKTLQKAYKWLKYTDLIPETLTNWAELRLDN